MGKLIYASNMSLDGWTEDAQGALDWAPPNDDVFARITELMASADTYLYGRLMYQTMAVWETDPALVAAESDLHRTFSEVWRHADKIVYSSTLDSVPTKKTRLERRFDPDAVRALKAESSGDLLVGGPNLGGQALRAGLVDECHLIVWPIVLGGQNPALSAGTRLDLVLLDEQRFDNGVVYLRYRTA